MCGMRLERNPAYQGDFGDFEDNEIDFLKKRLFIGILFAIPVLLAALPHMLPIHLFYVDGLSQNTWRWIELLFATPVVFWAGGFLLARGVRSIRTRNLNMFTLILLGVSSAYAFSTISLLAPDLLPQSLQAEGPSPLYFETAVVITLLVILGQWMEAKTRAKTGDAIQELLRLRPEIAHKIDDDGIETEIPIDTIQRGDTIRIRPGEAIPVDGILINGNTHIDESMLTGEAMPIARGPGDPTTGGTLNQTGSVTMQATATGEDTVLARIVELVAQAQQTRAPIQKLADQVSAIFVPAVVLVAAISFVCWIILGPSPSLTYALVNAVAVLIIACPCALGLATPMAITVGIGQAARFGLLIRDAETIEKAEKVTHLIIDKTGTLTKGQPTVTAVFPLNDNTPEFLLGIAAAAESPSEHPLALAVITAAQKKGLTIPEVQHFQSHTGKGVEARLREETICIGSQRWIEEVCNPIDSEVDQLASKLEAQGNTVIWVARINQIVGYIAIADPIKETTANALEALRQAHIKVIMATGDSRTTASHIANKLQISTFHSEQSPEDKQNLVHSLQAAGHKVAMAGDGINDAPALASAEVGIAMGTGTNVAIESADITLISGDLHGVASAFNLSRAVMKNIRQNLFFAFFYNGAGVPLAAGILYPITAILLNPMLAGVAMALSSVSVMTNALRLKAWKPQIQP